MHGFGNKEDHQDDNNVVFSNMKLKLIELLNSFLYNLVNFQCEYS